MVGENVPAYLGGIAISRKKAMFRRLLSGLPILLPVAVAQAEPTPFLNAQLRPTTSGTNLAGPFLRGTQAVIDSAIIKCTESVPGCPIATDRSSLYYRLPPGMTYVSHWAATPLAPATCTTAAAPDGGQHVACTGGGLTGWSWAINHQAQLRLTVAVAADAPLGPVRIVMAVDDNLPAQSITLDECLDDAFPNYCDVLDRDIEVAPAPGLRIDQMTASPAVFEPDDESARINIVFRNTGTAPTTGTHLQVSLPPGFQWQLATTGFTGLTMGCSAAGNWQTGQVVTCSGGALPFPTAANPNVVTARLGIRPRGSMEFPGPLPVVASLNDGAAADSGVLLACTQDPSPAHCAWLDVPTWIPCAYAHADGIYCDGFELPEATGWGHLRRRG
ncbi:hypothetical protein B1808_02795 [Pseudofulvimonas gallinarii]|jgi:hypothetical protein|nr:hypothetical protein B1808_02795 [Pseudofulvimonas gallinarii]